MTERTMENKDSIIYDICMTSRRIEPYARSQGWSISDVLVKTMEEVGEYSEAIQIERGKMPPHKTQELNAPFDEAADVYITVIDGLCRTYPNKSLAEITTMLEHSCRKKCTKWESIVVSGEINNGKEVNNS